MLGLEFVCAAAVSAESSFYHMSGPISGQNSDEKLGGNCLGGGRRGGLEGELVTSAEGILGSRVREAEGRGWARSPARPAHCDKEPHMNGHHFVLLYCSKQMNLFFSPLEDRAVFDPSEPG